MYLTLEAPIYQLLLVSDDVDISKEVENDRHFKLNFA